MSLTTIYQRRSANSDPFSPVIDEIEEEVGIGRKKEGLPDGWRERVRALFPGYFEHPFSDPHIELWVWVDDIEADDVPRAFIALWARDRGKSTTAEAAAVDMGARETRRYCWYVSGTQAQADKHVATCRDLMESRAVEAYFPAVGKPKITKTGARRWRRNLMVAENGFAIEAVGLDKAIRGGKIESQRPDLIILDDIDEKHDTENAVTKKEGTLTSSILPAGAHNCAVLFVQNVIHDNSIAFRLSKRPGTKDAADYLADRIISGPHAAMTKDLEYEYSMERGRWVITAGKSLWRGFTVAVCEAEINREGPTAFMLESQHDVDVDDPDALLSKEDFDRTRVTEHPRLTRIGVGVDPPGGATACGIVCVGKARIKGDWHGFTLEDASTEVGVTPKAWALDVLKCYHRNDADVIFVERNYGGDMVANTIRQTKWKDADGNVIVDGARVKIVEVNASRGKQVRAEPVGVLFELNRAHHVGSFTLLEREWRRWKPGEKDSPNRLDAEVWGYTGLDLLGGAPAPDEQPEQESKWGNKTGAESGPGRWRKFER